MAKKIYTIGGGTCCGKSSISAMLSNKYNLYHYQQDDYLFEHIKRAAGEGSRISQKALTMSSSETWLRDPAIMRDEEAEIYHTILGYSLEEMDAIEAGAILAEGAGFMPDMMASMGVGRDAYVCMIPTREFRLEQYSRRDWAQQVLDGIEDRETAFANWMERDALLGDVMAAEADKHGYKLINVDGGMSLEQTAALVAGIFAL